MTYFFLTNRNVIQPRNGKATFGNDLSTPSYVISRKGASTIDPDDREKGTGNSKRWAQAIIEAAGGDTRDSHIVFFVPGFNTDAKDAYETNKILSENLVRNGLKKAAFVTFSWPSNGNIHQYLDDDNDARASAIHLVKSGIQVFAKMCAPDCNIRLHVISHSMGALVVREAFRAATGKPETRQVAWGISQLIFFGADISARSLESDLSEPMFKKAQRVTNYFNRHDKALATSNTKRFLTSPRLGRHGAPRSVLHRVVDIDVSDHWKKVARNNEAGPIQDQFLSHSFYRDDKNFGADVVNTILGDMDRRNMPNRQPHEEDGRMKLV